jgi:hypothetical protein
MARVEILEGTAVRGTSTTAPFTVSIAGLPAGSHTVVARAVTNANKTSNSSPVSFTLLVAPTVTLTNPVANTTVAQGTALTLQASAASPGGTLAKVDFFSGTQLLGSDTTAPYALANVILPAGPNVLTAVSQDEIGQRTTSAAVPVTVTWNQGAYLEQGGTVVFEAEGFASQNANGDIPWVVENLPPTAAGTGYVVVKTTSFEIRGPNEPSAELSYPLQFVTPGTYKLYARKLFPNNSANSAFFRIDNATPVLVEGAAMGDVAFNWVLLDSTINIAAAGVKTFTLKRREPNAKFDRFAISKGALPTGVGPPVSPKQL